MLDMRIKNYNQFKNYPSIQESKTITSKQFEESISNLSDIINHLVHSYLHKNNIPHGDGQSSEELKMARQMKADIIESLRNKDSEVLKDLEDLIGDNRSLNYDLGIIKNYQSDKLKTQVLDKYGDVQEMFEVKSDYNLVYPVFKFSKFEEEAIDNTSVKIQLDNALFVEGSSPTDDISEIDIKRAKAEKRDGVIFSFMKEIFYVIIFDRSKII